MWPLYPKLNDKFGERGLATTGAPIACAKTSRHPEEIICPYKKWFAVGFYCGGVRRKAVYSLSSEIF